MRLLHSNARPVGFATSFLLVEPELTYRRSTGALPVADGFIHRVAGGILADLRSTAHDRATGKVPRRRPDNMGRSPSFTSRLRRAESVILKLGGAGFSKAGWRHPRKRTHRCRRLRFGNRAQRPAWLAIIDPQGEAAERATVQREIADTFAQTAGRRSPARHSSVRSQRGKRKGGRPVRRDPLIAL